MYQNQKRILVIGASDNSDGSGLEADQKVIAAHGCLATTATTALTARSARGGLESHCPPASFVQTAIDSCFDGGGVEVVKIGLLGSVEVAQIVVDALRQHDTNFVVMDRVPIPRCETLFVLPDTLQRLQKELLQLTTVLTLGISEAVLLLKEAGGYSHREVSNLDDLVCLSKALHALGPEYVLVKGDGIPLLGSSEVSECGFVKELAINVLYDGIDVSVFKTAHAALRTPQGAGSALASAITSNLALEDAVPLATQKACRYIEAGISKGNGGIDYFHSTYTLPFSPGFFIEYLLNREDVQPVWHAHVHHDFVKGIGDGTLPIEKFKAYLVQDYLFLVQFARAKALSAYKTNSIEDVASGAGEILHIQREMSLHLDYCAKFGLSKKEVEEHEEHQACTAYTRYVLDIAHSESWFALQMAFAPCLLGYGIIARRLWDDSETVREQDNPYWNWIQNYVAGDYRTAVEAGEAILEKHAALQSPSQIESLVKIFLHATKMETGFWNMGNE